MIVASVEPSPNALTSCSPTSLIVRFASGSVFLNSALISSKVSLIIFTVSSLFSSSTTTAASASVGIALSATPPSTVIILIPTFWKHLRRILPIATKPFILYWSIAVPECPPVKPSILNSITYGVIGSLFIGRLASTITPPAQPTTNLPSCCESAFSKILPLRSDASSFVAPIIPTSSSIVNTHSSGGCLISSLSRIASM